MPCRWIRLTDAGKSRPPPDVVPLVHLDQPPRPWGDSKPMKTPIAAGPASQFEQLVVVCHVDRRLGRSISCAESAEIIARSSSLVRGDVLRADADEVVVDDQDALFADQAKLRDDIWDRAVAIGPAVERADGTEAAVSAGSRAWSG